MTNGVLHLVPKAQTPEEELMELTTKAMKGRPFVVLYLVPATRSVACVSNMPEQNVKTLLRSALGEET